jgi:hypothetical protein
MRYLIDTHVALWVLKGEPISEAAKKVQKTHYTDFRTRSGGNGNTNPSSSATFLRNV